MVRIIRQQRHKFIGEQQPAQDLTVFVDINPVRGLGAAASAFLHKGTRIEVIKLGDDGNFKIARTLNDITDPERLRLAKIRGQRVVSTRAASLVPKVGKHVYDTRTYTDDEGAVKTERHLGHKVVSVTS